MSLMVKQQGERGRLVGGQDGISGAGFGGESGDVEDLRRELEVARNER